MRAYPLRSERVALGVPSVQRRRSHRQRQREAALRWHRALAVADATEGATEAAARLAQQRAEGWADQGAVQA